MTTKVSDLLIRSSRTIFRYFLSFFQIDSPPLLRHHNSGHFRSGSVQIWDPHPQYEIRAFGEVLHLRLTYNAAFLPDKLPVHTLEQNYTQRVLHESPGGCFYTGRVQGDSTSSVAVSLCNGMVSKEI